MLYVFGSAPYVPGWLDSHESWQHAHCVVMNKAWRAFIGRDKTPETWSVIGHVGQEWRPPDDWCADRIHWNPSWIDRQRPMRVPRIDGVRQAPILVPTLIWLANRQVNGSYRQPIMVVGSDFDWSPASAGLNTCYGSSPGFNSLRPLALMDALRAISDQFARWDVQIWNAGEHEPTHLPWDRITVP